MTNRMCELIHLLLHTVPDDETMAEAMEELFSLIGSAEDPKGTKPVQDGCLHK